MKRPIKTFSNIQYIHVKIYKFEFNIFQFFFFMAVAGGYRISELLAMTIDDVDDRG